MLLFLTLFCFSFFFFNDTATTEIYTLSLHDALPISQERFYESGRWLFWDDLGQDLRFAFRMRSEEHTSELQSPCNLVCRLLLEKKKKKWQVYHRIVNMSILILIAFFLGKR